MLVGDHAEGEDAPSSPPGDKHLPHRLIFEARPFY